MVVDDSPFSRMMIGEALSEGGFDIVGEADSLESLIETYNSCKPDIVTMDIAMPGADGFKCSKELRINDPKAKIVLVSSMKDEESEIEAKRLGISGYIQKPIDRETLIKVIHNIMSPDSLFELLMERGLATFNEALAQNIIRMAKTPVIFTPIKSCDAPYLSQGITAVIGITGQSNGSMIMDLSVETSERIAEGILRRPAKNQEEVQGMVAELANIIAGIACSMLNKKDKAFALRVSPPSLFHGNTVEIVSPSIKIQRSLAHTDFGKIFLGVGFQEGVKLWM
jgi:DNA-binding NarL/FixJ family response regulator